MFEKPSKLAKFAKPSPSADSGIGFPNGSSGDPAFGNGGIGGAGAPRDEPELGGGGRFGGGGLLGGAAALLGGSAGVGLSPESGLGINGGGSSDP